MSINLNVDVSGVPALLQRASALIAGNRAQHGANERLGRVKERAGDLDLAGKGARQKMADAFEAAGRKRLAEQRRQQDSWADRKPIGHRNSSGYPVAAGWYRVYKINAFTETQNSFSRLHTQGLSYDIYSRDGSTSLTISMPDILGLEPYTSTTRAEDQGVIEGTYNPTLMVDRYYNNSRPFSFVNYNIMSFPVGPNTCLVAVYRDEAFQFYQQYQSGLRVNQGITSVSVSDSLATVLVGRSSVRRTASPTAFKAALDPGIDRTQEEYALPRNCFYLGINSDSFASNALSTPSVYQLLTDFADPGSSFPYSLAYGYNRIAEQIERFGQFLPSDWLHDLGNHYTNDYLNWPIKKLKDTVNYTFGAQKPNPKSKFAVPDLIKSGDYSNRITSWDWGRPGYCREQLYALGFTAADLTP